MRLRFSSLAAMAALFAMAACSSHGRPARPRPVFSLNGEILTAGGKDAPDCPTALGGWWDRIAAAHGGVFTREALIQDANTQFDAMDLDHDGFITPSELSDYRAALDEDSGINEPIPAGTQVPSADNSQVRRQRRGGGGSSGGPGGGGDVPVQPRVRANQIPADVVDPVMSADKSLSFKVSREDFIAQANEIFTELDKDHDGKLSKQELADSCPAR
jgi:hypothetical protein